MIEYKYRKKDNKFTENGHTMFEVDVLERLKRLSYLEEQVKQGQLLPKHLVISDELTTDWLMDKHPELTAREAMSLKWFCFNRPAKIRLKGCYGNGENMLPKWQESLKQN